LDCVIISFFTHLSGEEPYLFVFMQQIQRLTTFHSSTSFIDRQAIDSPEGYHKTQNWKNNPNHSTQADHIHFS